MRIPLIRIGQDETPIAWWEWLFAPAVIPLCLLYLLAIAVCSIPLELGGRVWGWRQEKRLRGRLAAAGRFVPWSQIEPGLNGGEGTLIVEHRSPDGPIREWWTEEDLIAAAPVPLPASLMGEPSDGQLEPLREYARSCAARFVDLESGSAKLTAYPVPLNWRLDPRNRVVIELGDGVMTAIPLPKPLGRRLAKRYPAAKVVTLVAWSDDPILAVGDAEPLFLKQR